MRLGAILLLFPALGWAGDCRPAAVSGVLPASVIADSQEFVRRMLVAEALAVGPRDRSSSPSTTVRATRITREGASDPYYVFTLGGPNGISAQGGTADKGSRLVGVATVNGGAFRSSGRVDLSDLTLPVLVQTNDWRFIQGTTGRGVRIGVGARVGIRATAGQGGPMAGYGVRQVGIEAGSPGVTVELPESRRHPSIYMHLYSGPELTLTGSTPTLLPVVDSSLGFLF